MSVSSRSAIFTSSSEEEEEEEEEEVAADMEYAEDPRPLSLAASFGPKAGPKAPVGFRLCSDQIA